MDFMRLFEPKAMAVIGISLNNNRHPANVIYNKNNLRYPVTVYPVNPKGGVLQGKKIYKKVSDIPEKVDLAVIAVRAEYCPDVMEECIHAEVGGAIVVSGGFAEVGGNELQERMTAIAKKAQFPFIGPNCLGLYSPDTVDTFFIPIERMVRPDIGKVAMISQSGGVLVDQMVKFAGEGVGLSRAVSIGNKAFIGEVELLDFLAQDPKTEVIALYVEGFGKNEGRKFVLRASRCSKPVIVLKAGKSPIGSEAVSSHTASLAGDYETFSSVLSQHGIIEAKNEFEMVSFCESLSCYPRAIEGKIGIITGSGGHGALAVDLCFSHSLEVPALSWDVQHEIQGRLTSSVQNIAALRNPIDLTGSARDDDFVTAANALSKYPDVDCIMILLLPYLPGITSDLGAMLSNIYLQERKPIIAYVPHVDKFGMMIEGFELNRIPVSQSIEGAVHMAAAMRRCHPC
jgi:acetyltransferase